MKYYPLADEDYILTITDTAEGVLKDDVCRIIGAGSELRLIGEVGAGLTDAVMNICSDDCRFEPLPLRRSVDVQLEKLGRNGRVRE